MFNVVVVLLLTGLFAFCAAFAISGDPRRFVTPKWVLPILLIMIFTALTARARVDHGLLVDMILKQLIFVCVYLTCSGLCFRTESAALGKCLMCAALLCRWIVIIGGIYYITSAPSSYFLYMIMACSIIIAAGFMPRDWMRLQHWRNTKRNGKSSPDVS